MSLLSLSSFFFLFGVVTGIWYDYYRLVSSNSDLSSAKAHIYICFHLLIFGLVIRFRVLSQSNVIHFYL